ncbi:MAG: hypothetical protein E5V58_33060, partial [Mesorhizobium sp.]
MPGADVVHAPRVDGEKVGGHAGRQPADVAAPEQRRARLRADATAHQDDPAYQSQIVDDVQTDPAAVKKAMADSASSHPPRWT